jgi:hypothetical protein
MGEKRLEKE